MMASDVAPVRAAAALVHARALPVGLGFGEALKRASVASLALGASSHSGPCPEQVRSEVLLAAPS